MSHETDPLVIDIPDALRHLNCWFNWRWAVQSDGGKFKLPVQPNGKPASSTGRETWYPYEKAAQAASKFEGLAIGLGHWIEPEPNAPRSKPGQFEWGVAGIDLDGAMEDGGGLKSWAAEILARVDSYAEFSPSGKGIHILVITDGAILPGIKLNLSETEHVEFYSTARYFTFTGNHLPGTPDDLKPREAVYTALRAEFEARRPSSARSRSVRRAEKPATAGKDAEQRVSLTDEELLFKAQSGPSGDAFKRLYEGDMTDYRQDHSAADMALAGRLAFWTGKDPEQIDRLFRESGLMRAKWDTRRGLSTYGEQTIEIAIDNCEDVYSGGDTASASFVEKLKAKRAAKVAETQKVGATVMAGHVQDHERGSDKPAHGAAKPPISEEKRSKPAPVIGADGVKRAALTGRVIEEGGTLWDRGNRDGHVDGDLFGPVGSVTAAERGQVSEGRVHVGIPPVPSRVEQADLFTGNGTFHGPVNMAETVNVARIIEQNGDGARENVHLKETVPLPVPPADPSEVEARERAGRDARRAIHDERAEKVNALPQIMAVGRPLQLITDEALDALALANQTDQRIFERSRELVRIVYDENDKPKIESIWGGALTGELARSAVYVKPGGTKAEPTMVTVPPPFVVVKDIETLRDRSSYFSPLVGIVEAPVLRRDGSVLLDEGYDLDTRLYYRPLPGLVVPPIPHEVTAEKIAEAVEVIDDIIGEFPFVNPQARANAIGLFLTPIIRPALPDSAVLPLALLDAPQQGTGKGLYADIVSIVATGRTSTGAMSADRDSEEWRKTITATLRTGRTFIIIDNISETLRNDSLSAILTMSTWHDRVLGKSEEIELPNRATWVATGNNLKVGGDLIRRTYRMRMNAHTSQPWRREGWKHDDLRAYTLENRGRVLAALLTLARAWYAAGKPIADTPVLGSYEPWSRAIGGILMLAGIPGFLGTLEVDYAESDDETPEWEAFLAMWHEVLGSAEVPVSQITAAISDKHSRLRGLLPDDLSRSFEVGREFNKVLGKALGGKADVYHGAEGLHLIKGFDKKHKVALWSVKTAKLVGQG